MVRKENMTKLLIISPFATHHTNINLKNLIPIFVKSGISCEVIDSRLYIAKFFDIQKYKKRREFNNGVKETEI